MQNNKKGQSPSELQEADEKSNASAAESPLTHGRPSGTAIVLLTAGAVLACACFYALSLYNYLLFHSLIELFAVAVAVTVFMVGWNTRSIVTNNTLFLISVGYLSVAVLDIIHTLAYGGMGVFPEAGNNLPTQLWMAARFVESGSLLAAALVLTKQRKIPETYLLTGYAVLTIGLLTLILPLDLFPDMYIEGEGLTNFKVVGEYVICGIVAAVIFLFWRKRSLFDRRNLYFLMAAFAATIAAELAFTLYVDVFGFFNFLGHLFKLISFVCIYQALVWGLLQHPYKSLFREVVQSRDIIQERKKELSAMEEELHAMLDTIHAGVALVNEKGIITYANRQLGQLFGCEADEMVGTPYLDYIPDEKTAESKQKLFQIIKGEIHSVDTERQYERPEGTTFYGHLAGTRMLYPDGSFRGLVGIITDITERKEAEQKLWSAYEQLDTLVELNADGIMVMDREGYILFTNPAAADMFGRNESELIGQQFGAPLTPGGSTEIELISEGNDPAVVELRTTKTDWGGASAYLTTLRDITDRKRREEKTRHLNSLLTGISEVNQLVVEISDLRTLIEKACLAVVNIDSYSAVAIALLDDNGHMLTSTAGTDNDSFFSSWSISSDGLTGDAPDCVIEAVRSGEMSLKHSPMECGNCVCRCPESNSDYGVLTVPMKEGDDLVGILQVHIRDRLESDSRENELLKEIAHDLAFARSKLGAEQSLRDRDAKLEAIIENAPYMMVLVDEERRVQQINAVGAQFAGKSPEEISGLHAGEALRCIHALDSPQGCGFGEACQKCPVRNAVLDTLANGERYYDVEVEMAFSHPGGEDKRTFLFHSAPVEVVGQQMALVVFDDITEYKQVQQQQKKTEEELQQALDDLRETQQQLITQERQQALTTMASGIAHDFNNALSPILGFADMLIANPASREDPEKLVHYLENIRTSANMPRKLSDVCASSIGPGKRPHLNLWI